ncbi:MAG: hypothetical protein JSU72_09835, partial [Deltaproteobacteria bacterium]
AIETYQTFVTSTSTVKDFQLKKDLVGTIASGYVQNIQIIKQEVSGRTVCTELIGYVEPAAVKGIIARKIEETTRLSENKSGVLVSNNRIEILKYKKLGVTSTNKLRVAVYYRAKTILDVKSVMIIVDCFDKEGDPIEGKHASVPYNRLSRGDVRKREFYLPGNTVSFQFRLD